MGFFVILASGAVFVAAAIATFVLGIGNGRRWSAGEIGFLGVAKVMVWPALVVPWGLSFLLVDGTAGEMPDMNWRAADAASFATMLTAGGVLLTGGAALLSVFIGYATGRR